MKKPRYQYALAVVKRFVDDSEGLLANQLGKNLSQGDILFMREFLNSQLVKNFMTIIDCTLDTDFKPLVAKDRPSDPAICDSLKALSELWSDLETFVMRTREVDEPEAHELYDLLADNHIRELLVAYDDIANFRYVMEDFDLVPIHTEFKSEENLTTKSNRSYHSSHSSVASKHSNPTHNPGPQSDRNPNDMSPDKSSDYRKQTTNSIDSKPLTGNQNHLRSGSKHGSRVSEIINRFEPDDLASKDGRKLSKSETNPHTTVDKHLNSRAGSQDDKTKPDKSRRRSTSIPKDPALDRRSEPRTSKVDLDTEAATRSPNSPSSKLQSRTKHSPSSPVKARFQSEPQSPDLSAGSSSLPDRHNRHTTRESNPGTQSLTRRHSGQRPTSNHQTKMPHGDHPAHDDDVDRESKLPRPGTSRYVHLRRDHPGESLGITVAVRTPSPPPSGAEPHSPNKRSPTPQSEPVLAIQRVLVGSVADRQGNLYPGDVLLEINGRPVRTLEEVHSQIQQTSNMLDCKLLVRAPSHGVLPIGLKRGSTKLKSKRYIRCFFDYDASKDILLPTGDVGLSFKSGDVLELVNDQDPNWWQVRPIKDPRGKARLIPSQTLEERRQAFNQEKSQAQISRKFKRKVKTFFRAADSSELRLRSDIWSYEEVVPWPQSMIPCLLLLGPNGVGRRTLKVLLAKNEPKRFAYPMSDTTDPNASTNIFRILSKTQMEADVRSGAYVEWGNVDGHLYGIRFSEIRKIIASGRTAVLDCQPQSVHLLHQPEFNPYTIFVAAPNFEVAKTMLQQGIHAKLTANNRTDEELRAMIAESQSMSVRYRHLYAHMLLNKDMNESVEKLSRLVSRLERQPCWIPCGWAYELSVPSVRPGDDQFIPGSSSLSALGISDLPASSRASALARSVLSGMSEASAESASRMARPPSICSSSGLNTSRRERQNLSGRLYEKRRRPHHEFQPLSPSIPEQDTPSESLATPQKEPVSTSKKKSSSGHPVATKTSVSSRNSRYIEPRVDQDESIIPNEDISPEHIQPSNPSRSHTSQPSSAVHRNRNESHDSIQISSKQHSSTNKLLRSPTNTHTKDRSDKVEQQQDVDDDDFSTTSSEDEDDQINL